MSLNESSVYIVCIARQARNETSKKLFGDLQTRRERYLHRQYGDVGGTFERLGSAGEAVPGAQGGSGAFKRETRSFDFCWRVNIGEKLIKCWRRQKARVSELATDTLLVRAHPPCPLTQTKQCRLPLGWEKIQLSRRLLWQRWRKEAGRALIWM